MSKHIVFCLILVLIGLVGCATPSPTPMPTLPPPTLPPPTLPPPTVAPTQVPPTATIAPTATAIPPTATAVPPTSTPKKEATVNLTWLGHPSFLLKTGTGLTVLLDPAPPVVGYPVAPMVGVDVVTVSHEHSDHNFIALASGSPQVLRGLAGNDWAKVDQTVKGVRIRTVNSYHDDTQGSARGKNAIFVYEMDGLKIAHLGDLGIKLTDDQIKQIGALDVVIIPVGGYYTIDGKVAAEVVAQLNPKIVVPMHYKTPVLMADLGKVLSDAEGFISALGTSVQVERTAQTVTISSNNLPAKRTVYVMNYK